VKPCWASRTSGAGSGATRRGLPSAARSSWTLGFGRGSGNGRSQPRGAAPALRRKAHRPAAITTKTSGSAASVQGTGRQCWTPSVSRRKTRYSPQACRIPMKTNSRLNQGWNGCVTRRVLASPSCSGVIDGVLQRVGRGGEFLVQSRADVPPGTVAQRRRRGACDPGVGRLVEHPQDPFRHEACRRRSAKQPIPRRPRGRCDEQSSVKAG